MANRPHQPDPIRDSQPRGAGLKRGTITTLADAGFSPEETIVWLFTHDETLPGRAIDLLRAGNKAEVRRRAQALAF